MASKKKKQKMAKPSIQPSSNWAALKQKLKASTSLTFRGRNSPGAPSKEKKGKRMRSQATPSQTTIGTTQPTIASTIINSLRGEPTGSSSYPKREGAVDGRSPSVASTSTKSLGSLHVATPEQTGKYVALDCEMVGVGPEGKESSLARVSIVNFLGHLVLDAYVKQREAVTDYRTAVSGITPEHVHGPNAVEFQDIQKQVADLLRDRVLVGHAVHNDLKALMLTHPHSQTRDTQKYKPLHAKYKSKYLALKMLAKQEVDMDIQIGEHNSVIDAQATMLIYRKYKKEWDKNQRPPPRPPSSSAIAGGARDEEPTIAINKRKLRLLDAKESPVNDENGDDDDDNNNTAFPIAQSSSPAEDEEERRSKKKWQNKADNNIKLTKAKAKRAMAMDTRKANKKLSSGLSVVVKHSDGSKDVLGKGKKAKDRASRDGAQRGATGVGSTTGTSGWWQTI